MLDAFKSMKPKIIKYKQNLILIGISLIIASIATILVFLDDANNRGTKKIDTSQNSEKKIEISKITNGLKANDKWLQKAENDLKEFSKHIEEQDTDKQKLIERIEELEKVVQRYEEQNENHNIDLFVIELNKMREEMDILRGKDETKPDNAKIDLSNNDDNSQSITKIHNYELKSNADSNKIPTYNLRNYLAAGSYAPAIIISGVDASVGVNAQVEPRPMLLRITGKARNATLKDQVQDVDITGCTVTAAASGDLSSERVFIRLLKMTCSRQEGIVFETEVHGYAASMGKAGIRGDVVSREGDFVFKSFLAGIASSAGNSISQKFTSPLANGLNGSQPSNQDIFNTSMGKGISNSSNKISDYLIQRAEQYQPVISVPAGTEVELVFNDGVYLDGAYNKKEQENEINQ